MKASSFAVVPRVDFPKRVNDSDFKLGRIHLAAHLGCKGVAAINVHAVYAKQLLLKAPTTFAEGRVPLFVCEQCGDLGCGALTVQVQRTTDGIVWQHFGHQGLDGSAISTGPYFDRTGPFLFDETDYSSVLLPFTRRR